MVKFKFLNMNRDYLIADIMSLSFRTIESYITIVFAKFDLKNREELMNICMEQFNRLVFLIF